MIYFIIIFIIIYSSKIVYIFLLDFETIIFHSIYNNIYFDSYPL